MALAPRLDLRQTQALIMTPQLQQAIKLLQLSNLELVAYVEQEIEKNPLLEREDGANTIDLQSAADSTEISQTSGAEEALKSVDSAIKSDTIDALDNPLELEYDDIYEKLEDTSRDTAELNQEKELQFLGSERIGPGDDSDFSFQDTATKNISLREHLKEQIAIDIDDPVERLIGLFLIESLDEAGYLGITTAQAAERLGCDEKRVVATLAKVQQLDPPGVFARDLSECLALQLRDRDQLDDPMKVLLSNLDLIATGQFDALGKLCGADLSTVREMVREVRNLNPKPALIFDETVAQQITPDVMMRVHPSGGWLIELNSDNLPRLLVNNQYYSRLFHGKMKRDEKRYLNQCFQTANWLVKALHQRATTILKVSTEIVKQQESFFAHGVVHLKPLVLRDIANAVELHESTVSRVTSNKYISTPRGIFELKYFFSQGVGGTHRGEMHSAEAVRHKIKTLIDEESPDRVLSDDAIVEILVGQGIEIARRTVAKYREAMGVPSSVRRRRQRLAHL